MCAKLKSTWKWNDLNGDKRVFNYLFQKDIYMGIDQFNTKEPGVAGYLLELYTTLVQKEELAHKAHEILEKVKLEGYKAVNEWNTNNPDPPELIR
eukprot:7178485-Ditylum_brightwellii.AAC.1